MLANVSQSATEAQSVQITYIQIICNALHVLNDCTWHKNLQSPVHILSNNFKLTR